MATAKMKIILPLVVWTWLQLTTTAQSYSGIGFGIKREIFFLNLEDGYFGCQVNESTDVLQLFELSKLCDGTPNCFLGSDELAKELKCTNDCRKDDGTECQNGACLDSQCHCNDGFGGCSCEVPDENECKYRPCDVFAHCTNTLGSFSCTCFPGYQGDGFHCEDINECDDPVVAARCVENAECCNLPAHFLCKCKSGFEGDGEVQCLDIDECAHPNTCGENALCHNTLGNYTCLCPEGYRGNPYEKCSDINECENPRACGPGAICTNVHGGKQCTCPPGYQGDAYLTGCFDVDECASRTSPCGRDALCSNLDGTFRCDCPPGFVGDPHTSCSDITCESHDECPSQQACILGKCQNPCSVSNPCNVHQDCQVQNHQPVCIKVCQCQHNSDCGSPSIICDGCNCIKHEDPVIVTGCEHCPPGLSCDPLTGACIKVGCTTNSDCPLTEACIGERCQRPCSVHNPCVQHAVCINTNHGSDCTCAEGFHGNGYVECLPAEYKNICQYNEDCPPNMLCDRLNRVCRNPCIEDSCGENALCLPKNHDIHCQCLDGYFGNPYVHCEQVQGCRIDDECNSNEACIKGKCSSPCKCGPNAICEVVFHKPTCKCPNGYSGNPITGCNPPSNPCDPNPCGTNAFCELDNGNPICFCPKGLTGNPFKNCIPEGNECAPNPCGPNSGCRLVGGKAICFCLPEYEGTPPHVPCALPSNPCNPSPCGPNTQCAVLSNGFAKCTCLPGYLESPNTIRGCIEQRNPCDPFPCGDGAQCDPLRDTVCFCPIGTIGNPYKNCAVQEHINILCQPRRCGFNADCYIANNQEQCYCKDGFIGDPYSGCRPIPTSPCVPNPCGPGAQCNAQNGQPLCQCPIGFTGDPTSSIGCHAFECLVDGDCADHLSCIGHRCRDPCPGACGVNANCHCEKHHPICVCNHGLTGNPLVRCYQIPSPLPENDPCMPSPCGSNTLCQVMKGRPVCSCMPDFHGDPQLGCKPECTINTDCPEDKACIDRRCKNPCTLPGICGIHAQCRVDHHTPTCLCPPGFMGDAFYQCVEKPTVIVVPQQNISRPCTPSPCPNKYECDNYGTQIAVCDICFGPNAFSDPRCRPECLTNSDCPFNQACLGQICADPCPGSCGVNAQCSVVLHTPICSCPNGLYGNPFDHCSTPVIEDTKDTCENKRCGVNADCVQTNNVLACQCKKGFLGNPYLACRPQCVINTDCPMTKACINNKCIDPCVGACGVAAQCETINHVPICYCPSGHIGDPFVSCVVHHPPSDPHHIVPQSNPCDPSPCGPFSRCLVSPQGYATCSCLPNYKGSPPMCKPECVVSSECPQNLACVNQKCVDPCLGTCGRNALCTVINHNPICSCPIGQQGDPFVSCYTPVVEELPREPDTRNPCSPSPCGPNSICQVKRKRPVCSCLPNFSGTPPYCRPECVINQECPSNKACIQEKCVDPCIGSCGQNARCDVINHASFCSCEKGYQGDAFIGCTKIIIVPTLPKDPCNPSPCGENAQCSVYNGAARCNCIPPYIGNPYEGGCRPECTMNSDCPSHLACLSQHCRDPCQGLCGQNAECSVVNHVPVCTCVHGFFGDPFTSCRREQERQPTNPCEPSPCGPNSICRVNNGRAVCSCQTDYLGAPPNCHPECTVSSQCPSNKACINRKCQDPCPGTCGYDAKCQVINHNPVCSCPPHFTGDPFVQCFKEVKPIQPPTSPCLPSPCGANAECHVIDSRPVCSCLTGMLGAPPNCRPECIINQDCPSHLACINQKCKNPCVGSCGQNAQCTTLNHQPMCSCFPGFEGDPFSGCRPVQVIHQPVEEVRNPCNPSPCGANAICKERNGAGSCTCLPEYFGDPYSGCRPECVMNNDCPRDKACINNKCKDPCPGTCGINAECRVNNHIPTCFCFSGYTGNPLRSCHLIPIEYEPPKQTDPCIPSPCGPYSQCRVVNGHAVCSCQKNYIGTPPACRPECMISAECSQDKACIGLKCQDPCPGTCGLNALCQVINHNPICSCPPRLTGDPFVKCIEERKPPVNIPSENPCIPSPCGPNSQCRVIGNQAVCSCLPNYIGRSPNCRPECVINSECPGNLACINERCTDPCPGSCGEHTVCYVLKHAPICQCESGYTGDPFTGCSPQPTIVEEPRNPCNPSPCGPNAICKERNGAGSCVCIPEYFGDPYSGCRPECVLNNDCPKDKACISNKCRDPCPGTCGINADCRVANHAPSCFCYDGYIGNPTTSCHLPPPPPIEEPIANPCVPSPCGPYSNCRVVNNHAVCSCQTNYIGTPPMCRPECMVSSDCPLEKACINTKCQDPCPGTCGFNARCNVVNHNPICSCSPGYTGDPFIRCIQEEKQIINVPSTNPCIPSPCGPNSQCRVVGSSPACSCLPNYIGRAPNCRPECVISQECPGNLACQNERCVDPCPGSCGSNANCVVIHHKSVCTCHPGFTGDPFASCIAIINEPVEEQRNPCNPSPCGANAVCKERNGAGSCTCLPEYFGDPYTNCRPECVTNSDCPRDKACTNNKCKDPCPGVCGIYAECRVNNHAPSCLCLPGYTGNPLSACHLIPPVQEEAKSNPCVPSPCGPYSQCRVVNDHAVCSCQKNYIGSPPACRPECMISADCPQDKSCINSKCIDPCPGTCGLNARCQVVNHNPICSCSVGYVGDPFVRCILEEKRPVEIPSGDPCVPSPCGLNSQCKVVGTQPACSCLPNFIGRPPNCRPECTINADCPSNLACQNEKCKDPCPGSCGSFTTCMVIKHAPICQCVAGYTGDPFSGCTIIPPTFSPVETILNPCNPSPCGPNAICKERNGAGSCSCLPEYFGDPYKGCRPECVTNTDCDRTRACVNNKCVDPCPGTCGINAECLVFNHAPSCICIPGYSGDPTRACEIIRQIQEEPPRNPCQPSPCGPYSQCREINGHAVCSCNAGYIGTPPMCKPECIVSSECPQNRACISQKCVDPCPGTCGHNAKCQVINHNPICTCIIGFTGDPFTQCSKLETPSPPKEVGNPCVPSPCGPNSQCKLIGNQPACSCLPNYIGRAPNCRPECTTNSECPNNLACQNEKCKNPCPGSCGQNAICTVVNHNPVCSCLSGYIGDALVACHLAPSPSTERTPTSPCTPSPCGPNTDCREQNGAGACICKPGFEGDPYDKRGCRRECEVNSDCNTQLACRNYKCIDPCPGTCGTFAECRVENHIPTCYCIQGYTGDPFFQCREIPVTLPPPTNPCHPSPCGPNSQCRDVNGQAVCSCLPEYIGTPPSCRPECVVSSECPLDRACINQKCADPCPNTCGLAAQCYTKNHNPICACPPGYTGDPFTRCSPQPVIQEVTTERPRPSCHPSPCGPNSQCQMRGDSPSCSCLPNYVGAPPNCRPECVISSECSSQLACINQKCRDPCPGSCGTNANCHVLNHVPICTCYEGHTGDPFTQCNLIIIESPKIPEDPCNPSPCGPNALCRDGVCTCLPEHIGNPYESCRPECVLSTECSRDKACLRNKCKDPCPGTCGQNARCDVINHIPVCSCPEGFTGDPFTNCRVYEPPKPEAARNPCSPSPCGPNSQCRNVNDHSVCSCIQGFMGTPPSCRPECVVSSECVPTKACVNQKCTDPCLGSCGLGARCEVINHSPICSCPEGQTGDPFQSCRDLPREPEKPKIPENPCVPSPCGPNSHCDASRSNICSCLPGYIGQPPNCRPECVINPDCPSTKACINNKCRDPCPGSCGQNTECHVISHTASCTCSPGYTGNPFVQCFVQKQEIPNPCEPSPCGPNAECKERNGAGACTCLPDYQGNPYEGCRPECVLSSDCPTNKACLRNKCADPCPGICGQFAECSVINHVPTCTCIQGYIGDPFTSCIPAPPVTERTPVSEPCHPSPCGPNSQCRAVNEQAVCSCLPEFTGSPPNCRPECVVSSECPSNRACYQFKCKNPCNGACGVGAKCEVINHNPICSCPAGLTGDPFARCYSAPPPPPPPKEAPRDPCLPNPCGQNSICRAIGETPSCSCMSNYVGAPPNCRPECVVNTDCPSTMACITEKCRDPCPGSCGFNAECRVQNHIPICTCVTGFVGDPFTTCNPKLEAPPTSPTVVDPCFPSPCGPNAQCNNGICTCLPQYNGDPYRGCRPECTMNSDCSPNKACSNLKCIDPCPGTCGQGARCDVVNHIPTCSCPPDYEGDPFVSCRLKPKQEKPTQPCNPSPCGPNSVCKVHNGVAVCSCLPGLIGSPPSCRPECVVSAECPLTQACLNQKCVDPCPGTCGINAKCQVVNHNPICSCSQGFTGDPFTRCTPVQEEPRQPVDPCIPSPCGPNSICQVRGDSPACSCRENFVGLPPNCKPECTINPECNKNLACINQKCRDPCVGSCGFNAVCSVVNHNPVCSCNQGFTGDPFSGCVPIPAIPPPPPEKKDPCYPSPCGSNAKCYVDNNYGMCECLPEHHGNPYVSCRPECVANSDCPMNRACIRNKCQDPCPGTCGIGAQCVVTNHIPVCSCPDGYTGNAFRQCTYIQIIDTTIISDPCVPSPCGPNTVCRVQGSNAICECLPEFFGTPTAGGCRPECTISADCPRNKACVNMKCIDPCPGVCGYNAQCHVINHSPVCSCPPPLVGDPFTLCNEEPKQAIDLCNPSPCRINGQCRVINGAASCLYPECVINQDCPRNKACYLQKCQDPCRDACGFNALCQVVNHKAICTCPPGYIGSPEVQCVLQPLELPKPECTHDSECPLDKACINQHCRNPCIESPNVCGINSDCRVQIHRPVCICREGYTGNAQSACFEVGCRSDSDCPSIQACVNRECIDPCSYTQCGLNAYCKADSNHKARCYCPESFRGNPQIRCERPECTTDDECSYNMACRNEHCEDPCNCGLGAICMITNHRPHCSCPPGYIGNPLVSCNIAPVEIEPQCRSDSDCPSKLACFNGVCKNPCVETRACGINAECSVVDTLPLRTMSCLCLPGYVGDADVECKLVPQEQPGCRSNDECPLSDACLNRVCVNPCIIANPCALSAECQPINHKAVCQCPRGLIGDPFIRCHPVPETKPECTSDSDCSSDKACTNQRCEDPCLFSNPCGSNAQCRTIQHRPTCNCPDGWGGNPQINCYKPECKVDSECPYDKACINENCLNPCVSLSCGRGAECVVHMHRAQCQCPAGTQGSPLISCITGMCQYNEDCADHEACDRLNRICRPVCQEDTCADTATCIGQNHQPKCTCPAGFTGNPYVECIAGRHPIPSPECRSDSECPSRLACINAICQDPCAINNMCTVHQECRVLDTLPLRTVVCQCPSDTYIDVSGRCKAIQYDHPQCVRDTDCGDKDKCVSGTCIDACKVDQCGVNALCQSYQHNSVCSCPPGYTGNAHFECTNIPKIPFIPIAECYSNEDCNFDQICQGERCVNPCIVNKPCGIGAFCSVNNHQHKCVCPSGYEGNPRIECIPPSGIVGCKSNSECAKSEACINSLCASPCNCGPYAECRVANHYPICYCKPGYSGNPQLGCVKLGCQSDHECENDKQCYNGQCINPCIITDPCANNAECFGYNHKASCRCPSDSLGNPYDKCERIECHVDTDCPNNKACLEQRCVNPCSSIANPPCAQNAVCFAQNHAAACICPSHLPEGNPLSYCSARIQIEGKAECELDVDCPSKLACIDNTCVNPCTKLSPCHRSSKCSVLDTIPVRTMICTCPEGWVPNEEGECHAILVPIPPGCTADTDCPSNEACINRLCRNPCDCGPNSVCLVQNHRPICSCKEGFDGNPNIACHIAGCRTDSECDSGKACVNGNCVNPCLLGDLCGVNAECYVSRNRAECRCRSGYRGNPLEKCLIVGCIVNNDCPQDRQCINGQCINPCIYENPCSPRAECKVQNHMALCRCPTGFIGNPYFDCQPEPRPECTEDYECPSRLACISNKCQDPCAILEPCHNPSQCEVVGSVPVRTMICVCPPGYISSGSGTCVASKPIKEIGECRFDNDCPPNRACVQGICKDPCDCGFNAECRIKDHKPICTCKQGYEGNPEIECVKIGCRSDNECSGQHSCVNQQCIPVCAPDKSTCGERATCTGVNHRAICSCPPGLSGDPRVACILVGCKSNSECPSNRACVNERCEDPCALDPCDRNTQCRVHNHQQVCLCPPGFYGDVNTGCTKISDKCQFDSDCPSQTACIGGECVNPCKATEPCGVNAECTVLNTEPVRTMICECLPGYQGNAAVQCDKLALCRIDKGFVRTSNGDCVCPPNNALNENDECVPCALEKGFIVDERGMCICSLEYGYHLDSNGNCVLIGQPECERDDHCPDNKFCNLATKTCDNPCATKECGKNALCNATNHRAICQCIAGYTGNPEVLCNHTSPFRTDFPRPEMLVSCLSDGVQVEIHITEQGFNGVLYVKGHSKDERCRRVVTLPPDSNPRMEVFKVQFGNCGLIHVNGQASFVLVIQKHPKLVTYKAQAYHIKCVYQTGEQNVTLGFNVSMLTTAGTIANTGPPPTCTMKIVTPTGHEINSAEIGDSLLLQVDVQPGSIYGGFARSCVAKTMEDNVENEYIVTDENGCATDPSIFGEWEYNSDTQSLLASFNAFKFPSSDNIRFQCNIRVCFGKCQPVNCRGYNAFGRRKREIENENKTEVALTGDLLSGQLREEITISSNAILTFERREERFVDPTEAPSAQRVEDICVSMIGFIIALIITALLALVAVAVAVSCWLLAYRRRPKAAGPLPHPPEFPNPLFTTPEPMAEPSPDYLT